MSFPPRPPLGMPPMMPGTYYAPMGMVPMGMRMMPPPMMRPVVNAQKQGKKLIPQEIPKSDKDDKPPVTTVFVGNISDKAPDVMIKQMLQRCGNVLSWKRVQGASGKLQAFGFCEYEEPEATLRCIRLLNDWYIPDKKLVVKVDAKTKTLLDDYRSKKKAAETTTEEKKEKEKKEEENGDKENGEIRDDESSADELDEFTKREDRVATAGLEAIMMEYAEEMNKAMAASSRKAAQNEEKKPARIQMIKEGKDVKDVGLDSLEVEEETKFIINREIRSFRDLHKDEEVDEEKEKREQERRNEDLRRRRERERERLREKEKSRRDDRREERIEKRREERHSRSRSRSPTRNRNYNRRERERERERTRSPDRTSRRKEQDIEDEEEAKERRKLEKKLREKEAAYKERLTNWEARERKKSRENDKEREREEERKMEENREGRRLKEFLEDYDDLRDDPKFFKGSALSRRMKEREKEKEADARDRQREKEEFEEIKRRLMNEGHPDPEGELARIEREREEHLKPRLQIQEIIISPSNSVSPDKNDSSDSEKVPMKMQSTLKPVDSAPIVCNNIKPSPVSDDDDDNTMFSLNNDDISEDSQQPVYGPSTKAESSKLSFSSLKLGNSNNSPVEAPTSKRKKLTVGDVFNQDDDSTESKKRKLIPLDYDEEKRASNSAEEKRNKIKILIDSIPTAKEELFAFTLDWTIVDQPLMDKRIKPWINKKIVEYIGEEEPTLTDFICQKVIARSTPASIQNDVAMVLDEEAEVFVVKMWRLLVYETEAKKLGLVK